VSILSRIFGRKKPAAPGDEPLVPVPVPALGVLLLRLEKKKGAPLTEAEVLEARDKAVCIVMRLSHKRAMEEKRGYRDVSPENVWQEWLVFRTEMNGTES
jgi:hypothetical protein